MSNRFLLEIPGRPEYGQGPAQPCPFCGQQNLGWQSDAEFGVAWIECVACRARGPRREGDDEIEAVQTAAVAWDARP